MTTTRCASGGSESARFQYGDQTLLMCAQACCTLQPAFPDLPDEHSETIEANIVNQNYTFVARHMFSRSLGAVCCGSRL